MAINKITKSPTPTELVIKVNEVVDISNKSPQLGADNKVSSSNLPIASSSVLGVVKQGANVSIAADGTISVSALPSYKLSVSSNTQRSIDTGAASTSYDTETGSGPLTSTYFHTQLGGIGGEYTLQNLLQLLVNNSHRHATSRNHYNCNCNCNCTDCGCGNDGGG